MRVRKITIGTLFFCAIFTYAQQDTIKAEKKIEDVLLTGSRNKKEQL